MKQAMGSSMPDERDRTDGVRLQKKRKDFSPEMSLSELNKLKAQVMKLEMQAKNEEAHILQKKYDEEMKRHELSNRNVVRESKNDINSARKR